MIHFRKLHHPTHGGGGGIPEPISTFNWSMHPGQQRDVARVGELPTPPEKMKWFSLGTAPGTTKQRYVLAYDFPVNWSGVIDQSMRDHPPPGTRWAVVQNAGPGMFHARLFPA